MHDRPWTPSLLDQALAQEDGRAFFRVVVEPLGDRFEPQLCEVYDRLFLEVIERAAPDLTKRARRPPSTPQPPADVASIYVLSRVTLGADVAVTSVLIDAAKRRWPGARIRFAGPQKNYELFEADQRVEHFPAPYARDGSLRSRLDASAALWIGAAESAIVIDPDSRLSQLGLIEICPPDRYFFFPSRSYGGASMARLPNLAASWAQEVFGVESRPYVAPAATADSASEITVSLGIGENPAKRIEGSFERDLLQLLAATRRSLLVDKGGSPEERARVEAALPPSARTHDGAFAPFAAQVMRSKLFVGYDSAAGHVASASEVPLISIARGFVNSRMAARWAPNGYIVKSPEPLAAIERLLDKIFA